MADIVRLNQQECAAAASNLKNKVAELRQYISADVQSTVTNMGEWWIGDAYEAFKEDFNSTKQILEEKVFQEIDDYIARLEKAVAAQAEQDTLNAGGIHIN